MNQVLIGLIPQLKCDHSVLLFEASTVSKYEILKIKFYVSYCLSLAL